MEPTFWQRVKVILVNIWPTIYKIINGAVYFVFIVIRGMIRMAISQIKF